jgi:hypothetical protein
VASLSGLITRYARDLMGVSAYQSEPVIAQRIDDEMVEQMRRAQGGQLQPLTITQQKWLLADLERCAMLADQGDMSLIGSLWNSMSRDGLINGLGETRTSGLVALPKRWFGDADIIEELSTDTGSRSVFDEMCPAVELAMLAADEMVCGVGVAELVPVPGRSYPVLVRLDPSFLFYNVSQGQWYYRSRAGLLLIEPGQGRWVLHTRARQNPWKKALWSALGRAFIHKEHAMLYRANFGAKLANPARVAFAPNAATEDQRQGFMSKLIAWGINSCFELVPGWDVKLLESNGRGWEVFGKEIETADLEIMIALAGQVVTVTGGTGFANADIHQTIKADLINLTANALAHTINTQILPLYVIQHHGVDALDDMPRIAWDTDPPEDRKTEAEALGAVAASLTALRDFLADSEKQLDEEALLAKFGVPIAKGPPLIDSPADKQKAADKQAVKMAQASGADESDTKKPGGAKPAGKPSSSSSSSKKPPPKGKKK